MDLVTTSGLVQQSPTASAIKTIHTAYEIVAARLIADAAGGDVDALSFSAQPINVFADLHRESATRSFVCNADARKRMEGTAGTRRFSMDFTRK